MAHWLDFWQSVNKFAKITWISVLLLGFHAVLPSSHLQSCKKQFCCSASFFPQLWCHHRLHSCSSPTPKCKSAFYITVGAHADYRAWVTPTGISAYLQLSTQNKQQKNRSDTGKSTKLESCHNELMLCKHMPSLGVALICEDSSKAHI